MKAIVKDIIETNIAISAKKGELLLNKLNEYLKGNEKVTVDFEGITDLTTAFLNVGIGHLYNNFSSQELNEKLEIINLDDLDKYLLSQVIERVKLNQAKDDDFAALIREVINDGDDA
ncbi:STAS-like domain-containing protein [Bacillus wiedmannii]|uniref:STAS-like domain-containing protein n=1 Tax=Bacillus wiedmannii TaxID=1890302 RepID=UPI001D0DCDC7|nr:STAS-like domain-containing protein [Bacillus wiedmannii]MCC2327148.1 STAS-like domain-containing protein [Bacillus wiedmannii]